MKKPLEVGARAACVPGARGKLGHVAEGAGSATGTGRFWVMDHQRRNSPKTGGHWVGLEPCDRARGELLEKAEDTEHRPQRRVSVMK